MKKYIIFPILILFFSIHLLGQSASEAERLFNRKEFQKAKEIYQSLLRNRPNDALNNYRYARCCYELGIDELAIRHFELSGNRYPLTNMYLGELYYRNYFFEKSVEAYTLYAETLKPDDSKLSDIEHLMRKSTLGVRLIARVENIGIIDSISVDKANFLEFYKFSKEIGSISVQTKIINEKHQYDSITYTTERGDRIYFSKLNGNNTDIFSSFRLLDKWSEPKNLSENVNTKNNENYPFLLLDGLTLFYAAEGQGSLGGYDIMMTKFSPNTRNFLLPENVGFPFNSLHNDYMLVIDEHKQMGWFATDRFQKKGRVTIYSFEYTDTKEYLRTDDDVMLRNVAQLKSFRRADKQKTAQIKKNTNHTQGNGNIHFVLSDSIVYNNYEDFKSELALKIFKEWKEDATKLSEIQAKLLEMRQNFGNETNETLKSEMSEKIMQMELQIMKLKNMLNAKLIDASNQEILFLKNAASN